MRSKEASVSYASMQWTPMAFARKPAQQFVVVELQDGLLLTQSGLRESVGQDAAMSRLGFSPRHEDVLGASGVTEAEDGTLAHFVFTLAIDGFPRGRACKTARWAPDERYVRTGYAVGGADSAAALDTGRSTMATWSSPRAWTLNLRRGWKKTLQIG